MQTLRSQNKLHQLFRSLVTRYKFSSALKIMRCGTQKHSFHLLGLSPYPLYTAFFLFGGLAPQVFYLHGLPFICSCMPRNTIIHLSFIGLYLTVISGFIAILRESGMGYHTSKVQKGLRLGMLLFILSEVMFFFAFFGGFFHYSLIPSITVGAVGPPTGTQELDVGGLPLANTLLLLTSGVTITAAHAYILNGKMRSFFWYLLLTILLGVTFLFCQGFEYTYGVKFSGRDNIYGSIFFITTGFHGLHVTIGTMFLLFCVLRHIWSTVIMDDYFVGLHDNRTLLREAGYRSHLARMYAFTPNYHFGFEAAAGYGHFVDVVGLFLFLTVYGGGGK